MTCGKNFKTRSYGHGEMCVLHFVVQTKESHGKKQLQGFQTRKQYDYVFENYDFDRLEKIRKIKNWQLRKHLGGYI